MCKHALAFLNAPPPPPNNRILQWNVWREEGGSRRHLLYALYVLKKKKLKNWHPQERYKSSSKKHQNLAEQSHLAGALKLLQIEIKMPGQGAHSEERSEQERLVCCWCCAVGILLMLNLQFIDRGWTTWETTNWFRVLNMVDTSGFARVFFFWAILKKGVSPKLIIGCLCRILP